MPQPNRSWRMPGKPPRHPIQRNSAASTNAAACRQASTRSPAIPFPASLPVVADGSRIDRLPSGRAASHSPRPASSEKARRRRERPNWMTSVSSCPHLSKSEAARAEHTAMSPQETTSCVRHTTSTRTSAALPRESPNPRHPSSRTVSKSSSFSPMGRAADEDGSSFCVDFACAFSIHEPPSCISAPLFSK